MERQVIVIVGATGVGKTEIAVEVAERLGTEIVSADSRQLYRGLDVGAAKPTAEQRRRAPHRLVDVLDPDEYYNVAMYERDALRAIDDLHAEGKTPIVVGGSGLYVQAVVEGMFDAPDADPEYRAELERVRREEGAERAHEMLAEVDPASASEIPPGNFKRVVRALEVYRATGTSVRELRAAYRREDDYAFRKFGLTADRAELYRRVERRADEMLRSGMIEETERALRAGYDPSANALNALGYPHVIARLRGEISLERAAELMKRDTRRFVKRQTTWFKRDKEIEWLPVGSDDERRAATEKIFKAARGD
jgi:tRNA dimethylallyltransferase